MANVLGKNPIFIDTSSKTIPQLTRGIYVRSIFIQNMDNTDSHTCVIYNKAGSVMVRTELKTKSSISVPGAGRTQGIWVKNTTEVGTNDIVISIYEE